MGPARPPEIVDASSASPWWSASVSPGTEFAPPTITKRFAGAGGAAGRRRCRWLQLLLVAWAASGASAVEVVSPVGDPPGPAATTLDVRAEDIAALRDGIVSGDLPHDLSLDDALSRFERETSDSSTERRRLADDVVAAITRSGVDRHAFLAHVPYLVRFGCHAQLTTLLLHDPGEDDYWLECCFYQEVMNALVACGTTADAVRIRAGAPERDRGVFLELAAELEKGATGNSAR